MQLQSIVRGEKREPTGQHNPGTLGDHAAPSPADVTLEFGRFRILTRRRQLLADGVPVEHIVTRVLQTVPLPQVSARPQGTGPVAADPGTPAGVAGPS